MKEYILMVVEVAREGFHEMRLFKREDDARDYFNERAQAVKEKYSDLVVIQSADDYIGVYESDEPYYQISMERKEIY